MKLPSPAADLLEDFDRPGADRWRRYASEMAGRFRAAFRVSDELGQFPALALDGNKRPVDAPASNMGHLLATASCPMRRRSWSRTA